MSKYVLYLDVSLLPRTKTDEYIKEVTARFRETDPITGKAFLGTDDHIVIIEVRNQLTHLDRVE